MSRQKHLSTEEITTVTCDLCGATWGNMFECDYCGRDYCTADPCKALAFIGCSSDTYGYCCSVCWEIREPFVQAMKDADLRAKASRESAFEDWKMAAKTKRQFVTTP